LRACKVDKYREWLTDMLEKYPKIKASRLFSMVQERGYEGGVSRLREFVSDARPWPKPEAFLRLIKLPGEEAQVDWAHFKAHGFWKFGLMSSVHRHFGSEIHGSCNFAH
jgi:transposase